MSKIACGAWIALTPVAVFGIIGLSGIPGPWWAIAAAAWFVSGGLLGMYANEVA